MNAPTSRQSTPTPVTSAADPADKPKTDEAKRLGEQEREAVENARVQVASIIGADESQSTRELGHLRVARPRRHRADARPGHWRRQALSRWRAPVPAQLRVPRSPPTTASEAFFGSSARRMPPVRASNMPRAMTTPGRFLS